MFVRVMCVRAQESCGRREWDSNPRGSRLVVFKTTAFDRSAIPPGGPDANSAKPLEQYILHVRQRQAIRSTALRNLLRRCPWWRRLG